MFMANYDSKKPLWVNLVDYLDDPTLDLNGFYKAAEESKQASADDITNIKAEVDSFLSPGLAPEERVKAFQQHYRLALNNARAFFDGTDFVSGAGFNTVATPFSLTDHDVTADSLESSIQNNSSIPLLEKEPILKMAVTYRREKLLQFYNSLPVDIRHAFEKVYFDKKTNSLKSAVPTEEEKKALTDLITAKQKYLDQHYPALVTLTDDVYVDCIHQALVEKYTTPAEGDSSFGPLDYFGPTLSAPSSNLEPSPQEQRTYNEVIKRVAKYVDIITAPRDKPGPGEFPARLIRKSPETKKEAVQAILDYALAPAQVGQIPPSLQEQYKREVLQLIQVGMIACWNEADDARFDWVRAIAPYIEITGGFVPGANFGVVGIVPSLFADRSPQSLREARRNVLTNIVGTVGSTVAADIQVQESYDGRGFVKFDALTNGLNSDNLTAATAAKVNRELIHPMKGVVPEALNAAETDEKIRYAKIASSTLVSAEYLRQNSVDGHLSSADQRLVGAAYLVQLGSDVTAKFMSATIASYSDKLAMVEQDVVSGDLDVKARNVRASVEACHDSSAICSTDAIGDTIANVAPDTVHPISFTSLHSPNTKQAAFNFKGEGSFYDGMMAERTVSSLFPHANLGVQEFGRASVALVSLGAIDVVSEWGAQHVYREGMGVDQDWGAPDTQRMTGNVGTDLFFNGLGYFASRTTHANLPLYKTTTEIINPGYVFRGNTTETLVRLIPGSNWGSMTGGIASLHMGVGMFGQSFALFHSGRFLRDGIEDIKDGGTTNIGNFVPAGIELLQEGWKWVNLAQQFQPQKGPYYYSRGIYTDANPTHRLPEGMSREVYQDVEAEVQSQYTGINADGAKQTYIVEGAVTAMRLGIMTLGFFTLPKPQNGLYFDFQGLGGQALLNTSNGDSLALSLNVDPTFNGNGLTPNPTVDLSYTVNNTGRRQDANLQVGVGVSGSSTGNSQVTGYLRGSF